MPHKPTTGNGQIPVYVSANMTNETKAQLRMWADNNEPDIWDHVKSLVYEDYAFSIRAENDSGFLASLRATEKCKQTANKGKMLIERGGTPERAVLRLLWAHQIHFERQWPKGDRVVEDDW